MTRTVVLQDVRRMRFEDVYSRYRRGRLSCSEAADLLGITDRTFRRWRGRYEAEGVEGLADGRVGRASPRRAPLSEADRIEGLYRERYQGWTVKHFHERACERHGLAYGYTWTKSVLYARGAVAPARRRSAHRKARPRKPMAGMMLHQDGSSHAWLAGQPACDLIVTLDDASSAILSAFLVEQEGTASSFRGLAEVIARHGLFCSLYTDRGSHYFYTPKAGEPVDRSRSTEVGRALAELGIRHIAAYSPEARGRSERGFATLQDRLTKELADAGITDMAAANRFLAEDYIPRHNARFAVAPELPDSAFVPYAGQLDEVLCWKQDRVVGRDNTVRIDTLVLQLPPDPARHHWVRATVEVRRYQDHSFALFHGPRRIARYDKAGRWIDPNAKDQAA
jgi:transposase